LKTIICVEAGMTENKGFAVVTGASSGIGKELARVFAEHGFDLLVTAESDRLESAVAELQHTARRIESVHADLATYDGVEKLYSAIQAYGRPVDAIALNAGVGVGGDFARETSLEDELNIIELNVTSTVHLAKRVLPQMVARRQGRLLFTSSIAGTMPSPLEAVYGASKAFVLSFARSLRSELKDAGVTVTTLMPGPTDTDFFRRAGMEDTEVGSEGKYTNDPAKVAEQGYEALMDGDDHVFSSSLKTKIQGEMGRFMPESVKAELHKKQAEPKERKK
jgi:short-subunit dehydrogenase